MRYLTSNGVIALAIILAACNPTLTIQSTGSPAPSLPDTTECIVLGWTDTTRPSITYRPFYLYGTIRRGMGRTPGTRQPESNGVKKRR